MRLLVEILICFERISQAFDIQMLRTLMQCPFQEVATLHHFSLGLWIRNHLLAQDSPLFDHLTRAGLRTRDEMSGILLELFYLYIHWQSDRICETNKKDT